MRSVIADAVRVSWALSVSALVCGCSQPLTEGECYQLLDHYTALLVREESPESQAQEVLKKQMEARALAASDPSYEFDRCESAVSREQYACAMRAPTVDAVEQCLVL